MREIIEKCKPFFNKETFFMFIFPLSLLLLIILSFWHILWKSDHETQSVMEQLNTVQRVLNQLSYHNQNPENFKETLSSISNNMFSLQKSVDQSAKSSDVDKITAQTTVIKKNIDELKKLVADSNNGKEFIDIKNLPFQVLSIDVISQQPFVSIKYDHHITPLGIGDTIAGWQIVDADYSTGSAEFKNNQAQYVKVKLQNLQG